MKNNSAKDLLAALQSEAVSSVVPPGFYTMQELCKATGISRESLRARIAAMNCEVKKFRVGSRVIPHYRAK